MKKTFLLLFAVAASFFGSLRAGSKLCRNLFEHRVKPTPQLASCSHSAELDVGAHPHEPRIFSKTYKPKSHSLIDCLTCGDITAMKLGSRRLPEDSNPRIQPVPALAPPKKTKSRHREMDCAAGVEGRNSNRLFQSSGTNRANGIAPQSPRRNSGTSSSSECCKTFIDENRRKSQRWARIMPSIVRIKRNSKLKNSKQYGKSKREKDAEKVASASLLGSPRFAHSKYEMSPPDGIQETYNVLGEGWGSTSSLSSNDEVKGKEAKNSNHFMNTVGNGRPDYFQDKLQDLNTLLSAPESQQNLCELKSTNLPTKEFQKGSRESIFEIEETTKNPSMFSFDTSALSQGECEHNDWWKITTKSIGDSSVDSD